MYIHILTHTHTHAQIVELQSLLNQIKLAYSHSYMHIDYESAVFSEPHQIMNLQSFLNHIRFAYTYSYTHALIHAHMHTCTQIMELQSLLNQSEVARRELEIQVSI